LKLLKASGQDDPKVSKWIDVVCCGQKLLKVRGGALLLVKIAGADSVSYSIYIYPEEGYSLY
jgi:hypothetical protein